MSGGSLPVPCVVCGTPRQCDPAKADTPCLACKRLYQAFTPLGDWVDEALCVYVGGDVFFPSHQGGTIATARQAVEVCKKCPVREQCLEYSIEAEEPWGVWGGVTETERRKIIKKRRKKGLVA